MISHRPASARILAVLLLGPAMVSGCVESNSRPSDPSLPGEFQGEWTFDRDRTLDGQMERATTEKERDAIRRYFSGFAELERRGIPMHADVRVSGNSIIGVGSIIEPQYDFVEFHVSDHRISGKALWYEDRHDPGDMSVIDITLWIEGGELFLKIGAHHAYDLFVFRRM